MAVTWFTADPHFNHMNIIHHARRPFASVDLMNSALVSNWNDRVERKDTVYIIGDFAFNDHLHWINALKGKKILIVGNHDKMNSHIKSQFAEVHDTLGRKINGQYIWFNHYGQKTWPGPYGKSWHLYGHSHGALPEDDDRLSFDVGVDVWNYCPVSFDTVKKKMESRKNPESNSRDVLDKRVDKLREENSAFWIDPKSKIKEK